MNTTPEGKILRAITDYLTKRKVFWLRLNTDGRFDMKTAKYITSPYTKVGTPDLVCTPNGQAVFLEVKAPKGRLSPEQVIMGDIIRDAGCEWYCVRSVADVKNLGL